ncbi:MAG: alpha/beta fold hydrolase [Terriglobales bacterium]
MTAHTDQSPARGGAPPASAEQRLQQLGITLPAPPVPFGNYREAVQTGNLLFLSGMLPTAGRAASFIGRVGAELDVEAGRNAAGLAALNALAVARQHLGSLDRVARIVRLGVAVATSGDVRDQPRVADAASELLQAIFGPDRSPCRTVYGVASLPLGVPVELELIFEVMESAMAALTRYRTTKIDGLSIFYREAGPKDAPTLLLLHGLPSASRMFEPLFARLADRYHLVAPDYPGFGHSDWPNPNSFAYTFDHLAEIMNHFTEALDLARFTLYMHDYGGPVGFRMALAHPDRIEALIVQDAVAHEQGLGANWGPRRAFWADRAANESSLRSNLLSLATTRTRHLGSDPRPERYNPDLWNDEFAFLNQPGQAEIQSELFYDYRTNLGAYPQWQAWLRRQRPRLLVLWGKYDLSFDPSEPEAFRRDQPDAQVHLLDAGHFALDTAADEIAALIRSFMAA